MDEQQGEMLEAPKKKSLWKVLTASIGLPLLFFTFVAVTTVTNVGTPQWFIDQYTANTFQPSAVVEGLVESSGMNSTGQFFFYAAEAVVQDAEEFNISCAELLNEESHVLGCYNGQIFLFNITDERIMGVKSVTAAHEMLHSAYDRLGILEKIRVDSLIEQELINTTNEDILATVELYSHLEPDYLVNELHSIFGTEAATLAPELSEYYDRYFGDRSKVVTANEKYMAVFKEIEARAVELEDKMVALEAEIKTLESNFYANQAQLGRDIDYFNIRADRPDGFASEAAFYAERNRLIARQNALQVQIDVLNAKIDEYNGYVLELQALGKDVEALQNNLNSQFRDTIIE